MLDLGYSRYYVELTLMPHYGYTVYNTGVVDYAQWLDLKYGMLVDASSKSDVMVNLGDFLILGIF